MKFFQKFLALTRAQQITLGVCIVHICALFGLVIHHFVSKRFRPARPMVIRTLAMAPKEIRTSEAPAKPAPKATAPQKQPPPPAKQQPKKSSSPKKIAPAAPSKPPPKENALLHEITESLQTLAAEKPQLRSQLSIPSKIERKAEVVPTKIEGDPTYGEYLVAFLQNALDLPEYGEVKAKIEIDRYGNLVECEILETKSRKNAEFLKNRLPELAFPCLNDGSHSFTITFRNVEMH